MGDFAKLATEAREAAGLTQQQVATAVGVSQPAVAQWEAGTRWPSSKAVRRLADKLRISATDLLAAIEADQERLRPAQTVELLNERANKNLPSRGTRAASTRDNRRGGHGKRGA